MSDRTRSWHSVSPRSSADEDFLSILDLDAGRARALSRARGAAEGRRALAAGAARDAARRPARRAAVREAVAAHALDVRDRRPRARRRRHRAAAPTSALGGREPIADVARNLERWVRRASSSAPSRRHVLEAVRRGGAAAARRQRADRRGASVPGARRLPDAARAVGRRCAAGPIAFVGDGNNVATSLAQAARDARRQRPRRVARRLRAAARRRAAGDRARRAHGARLRAVHRRRPTRSPAPTRSTPTSWTSMGQEDEADAAPRDLRAVPGERRADGARQARTRSSCTACRRIAAKKSPPRSSTAPPRSSSIRPRTGCTRRRRCSACSAVAWRQAGQDGDPNAERRDTLPVSRCSTLAPCGQAVIPRYGEPDVFEMRTAPDPDARGGGDPYPRPRRRRQLRRRPGADRALSRCAEAADRRRLRGRRPR